MGKRKLPVAPLAGAKRPLAEAQSAVQHQSKAAKKLASKAPLLSTHIPNTRDAVCRAVPRENVYKGQLQLRKKATLLKGGRAVALSACDEAGQLKSGYCIVEAVQLADQRRELTCALICSCEENATARERLLLWRRQSRPIDQIVDFELTEIPKECLHGKVVRQLFPQLVEVGGTDEPADEPVDDSRFDRLQTKPIVFAIKCEAGTYGIVAKGVFRWRCHSCDREKCPHTTMLKQCGDRPGFDRSDLLFIRDGSQPAEQLKSVSQARIPFPLGNVSNPHDLPSMLVPDAVGVCSHGNAWSADDPVENGWIRKRGARLHFLGHLGFDSRIVMVCYRATINDACDCMADYDGMTDSIINLNNSTLVHYGVLIAYLSAFTTCGQALDTFYRAHVKAYELCGVSGEKLIGSKPFRQTWNVFVALLDTDPEPRFYCPDCGQFPETIILDGHALGIKQHLLPVAPEPPSSGNVPPLTGSRHADRVLLRSVAARRDLRRFATDDQKTILTEEEYVDLLQQLGPAETSPLRRVVEEAKLPDQHLAKEGYRCLLKECARNTPVVGIMPLLGNTRSRQILEEIVGGTWTPCRTDRSGKLDHLLKHLPVLTDALSRTSGAGPALSAAVRDLLAAMLRIHERTFAGPDRSGAVDAVDANADKAAFFPHWPVIRTVKRYKHDVRKGKGKKGKDEDDADRCTKKKLYHPVLSPGIVAYVCRHGVCYGFTVMDKPESPRMPFELFWTRWPQPPKRVVYDNSCRLHLFCLNREPRFFERVHFLVDRFHMLGHTGCSKSYDMAKYPANNDIATINSQFCEQLNSILIKLKPSLSYMRLERFKTSLVLFIGIRKFLFPFTPID